ncbi:MAG: M23 family metallopeptidase [Desulfocapsaceae bacterium]|nr:M23 family metallopeptidase [Desulfocapsaceae bacterium]
MEKKLKQFPEMGLDYCEDLAACNPSLHDLTHFYLYPGMEFQSQLKWWPDSGLRPTLHEGIDFCYYRTSSGKELTFSPEIRIPVMASGKIMAICQDYLGHTVFLDHLYETTERFLSIYAHIVPQHNLNVGQPIEKGEVIGKVADTSGRKNRMPGHLHLSIMKVDRQVSEEMLTWDLICNSERSRLIDPLEVIIAQKITMRKHNHWKEEVMKSLS